MAALLVVLVFTGSFLAAALAVMITSWVRDRRQTSVAAVPDEMPILLRQEPLSTLPVWRPILNRIDGLNSLKQHIEEAGVRWSVGRVTTAMLLLGAASFALFFNAEWAPTGSAAIAAGLGGSLPYWILLHKRRRRLRRIEAQFSDALDSLARSMRAGHSLSGALLLLAQETPSPLGPELRKLVDENRLGLGWEAVLDKFSKRIPILEVRLFVAAVLIQTRTGGRLTEVLERLADTIRESAALRGEVRAISAQGRLTGAILTILPACIAAAMYATNAGGLSILLSDPRGKLMLWISGVCLLAGHFVIQRIVDIKAPQ